MRSSAAVTDKVPPQQVCARRAQRNRYASRIPDAAIGVGSSARVLFTRGEAGNANRRRHGVPVGASLHTPSGSARTQPDDPRRGKPGVSQTERRLGIEISVHA